MDLQALLHSYGYALIFLGTLAEGESLLVLGGIFAHRGFLDLRGVMLTAYLAAVCGDQMFFHLGRRHAKGLLVHFPRLRDKVNLALRRIESHQTLVVLSMRFLWGLRIALPVALGLTGMSARRYFLLDLVSAAVWAVCFSLLGYGTGRLFSHLVENFHSVEKWIALGLLLLGSLILFLRWHGARRTQPPDGPSA
ncbi:MAG: DedA family protein [Pseudomonadota bacterium]